MPRLAYRVYCSVCCKYTLHDVFVVDVIRADRHMEVHQHAIVLLMCVCRILIKITYLLTYTAMVVRSSLYPC